MFIEDIERLIGPRPSGMTLDRENNEGNYEPGNVRWATRGVQGFNRGMAGLSAREREIRRQQILDLWSIGEDVDQITENLGVLRKVAVNDVRWAQWAEYRYMVHRAVSAGESSEEVAARLGLSFLTVQDALRWVADREEYMSTMDLVV